MTSRPVSTYLDRAELLANDLAELLGDLPDTDQYVSAWNKGQDALLLMYEFESRLRRAEGNT